MKKILVSSLAIAAAAAFVNTQSLLAAEQQGPATPGTPAATDSKTQMNNPPGPTANPKDAQAKLHPKEGSKNAKMLTNAKSPSDKSDSAKSTGEKPSISTTAGAGAKATKTPQVSMPPSTPNNQ